MGTYPSQEAMKSLICMARNDLKEVFFLPDKSFVWFAENRQRYGGLAVYWVAYRCLVVCSKVI